MGRLGVRRAGRRAYIDRMVRISITPAAFDAISATLPLGSVGYEGRARANLKAPVLRACIKN